MLSDIAIRARGLSKCYPIFDRPEDRLKQMLSFGRRKYYREFWALREVSFEVRKGEAVGIIGRNGSGKSTLLQIICGTLTPTSGVVQANGRIAALLELGSGFNPEFTGRENIYMNGTVLGLTKEEIRARFNDIVSFADIGNFIEQPVKTYSSGMYARLAFAVAINVDPDILVVDETLSVGDEAFQRKCLARIKQIRENGGTILFVSHATSTIVEVCNRAILIDQGERLITADPKTAVSLYQKMLYARPERLAAVRAEIKEKDISVQPLAIYPRKESDLQNVPARVILREADFDPGLVSKSILEYPSHGCTISDVHFRTLDGRRVNVLVPERSYQYRYSVTFSRTARQVGFGMMIKTVNGIELAGTRTHFHGEGIYEIPEGTELFVTFEFKNFLLPGTYFTNAGVDGVVDEEHRFLHRILDAVMFRVDTVERLPVSGYVDLWDDGPRYIVSVKGGACIASGDFSRLDAAIRNIGSR